MIYDSILAEHIICTILTSDFAACSGPADVVYGTELIKQTWSAGGQHGWKLAAVFDTGREFSDEERAQDYWSDDWRFKDSMLVFEAPPPPGFTPTGLVNMGHVVGGYAVAQPVQPMQKHVSSQPAHVPPPPPPQMQGLLPGQPQRGTSKN